jgi:hypothetical protein
METFALGTSSKVAQLGASLQPTRYRLGLRRMANMSFSVLTGSDGLLPALPCLFDPLGGGSWTVYRFLTQHHPELDGDTTLSALQRGKVSASKKTSRLAKVLFCSSLMSSRQLSKLSRRAYSPSARKPCHTLLASR